MEPASAVEMFINAPKQKVKYAFYTGDNDPTTETHIRQKVSYGDKKFSDIVHFKRSLTTRLYNLSHNAKFADSFILSQKVINYLVKCFSYGVAQNKGNAKAIQAPLTVLFPTLLATIETVTISGVTSSKIQLHINITTFLMGIACTQAVLGAF